MNEYGKVQREDYACKFVFPRWIVQQSKFESLRDNEMEARLQSDLHVEKQL